ncbi:glycosyltransferase family 2 protein [Neobacillus niacini]|uniref:glycosyltransferase family 2 protein n=1 Tax=Neobacillus niacini TaxID=86668 RepID=UPI0005EEEAEB|nr:glycosyltransferase family 2 protein [Neobacillus niacini]
MKIEVLVSTMNQKDMSLVKKMSIKTDTLIINQCNNVENKEVLINGNKIRCLSYNERGLSKSRNRAIENASGEICIIADDDVVYHNNYEKVIYETYKKYQDVDIIAFQVPTTNKKRSKKYGDKIKNINFINSMKIASFEITFKRHSIIKAGVKFDELFGAGSQHYRMGEENIFLMECLRKGLKILYVPYEIGLVSHEESTWFNGFNEKYFFDKGACFYAMSRIFSTMLIIQFAIRKYQLYSKEISFLNAIKHMLKGLDDYKSYCKR